MTGLRTVAPTLSDSVAVMPYAAIGDIHGDPIDPMPTREHSALLNALPDEALDRLISATCQGNRQRIVEIRALGGEIARPPAHPTAVCHRQVPYALFLSGVVQPGSDAVASHARHVLDAVSPWTAGGLLANFAATDDPDTVARCYDADAMHWLTALAEEYDPDHLLHTGQVARLSHVGAEPGRT